jgi:hypothetical protein
LPAWRKSKKRYSPQLENESLSSHFISKTSNLST